MHVLFVGAHDFYYSIVLCYEVALVVYVLPYELICKISMVTKCCNNLFVDHTSSYARFCVLCTTCQHKGGKKETQDPSKEVGT